VFLDCLPLAVTHLCDYRYSAGFRLYLQSLFATFPYRAGMGAHLEVSFMFGGGDWGLSAAPANETRSTVSEDTNEVRGYDMQKSYFTNPA